MNKLEAPLHTDTTVILVIRKLEQLGFQFSILGGYPRDLAAGRTPKDMDICVYSINTRGDMYKLREWLKESLILKDAYEESSASASGDRNVQDVYTLTCGVDIIFWKCNTEREVLDGFDFNINQYKLVNTCGETCVEFHGESMGELKPVRELSELSSVRVEHIIDIAKQIGWQTCQVQKMWQPTSLPTPQQPNEN